MLVTRKTQIHSGPARTKRISQPIFDLFPKVINGGISGVAAGLSIYPLDLVKTRLQSQQIGPNGERMYKSLMDCFRKIYQAEGYAGLYKGLTLSIVMIIPEKIVKFNANDFFRYRFATKDGQLSLKQEAVAGGFAGMCQITVTSPIELVKVQMQDAGRILNQANLVQNHGSTVSRISAMNIALNIYQKNGIFGFYRGFGATALRDGPFSVIYFPLFANTQYILNRFGPHNRAGKPYCFISFASGCIAGTVVAYLVTPFDVIKTRVQLLKRALGEMKFNGIIDCFEKTIRYEGPMALFKGGLCRVTSNAPLFGIAQMVYDLHVGECLLGVRSN